jgi:Ca-activated chloride channel family protein
VSRQARRIFIAYFLLIVLGGSAAVLVWKQLTSAGDELRWRYPLCFALVAATPLLMWVGFHLRRTRSASFSYSRVHVLSATRRGWIAHMASLPAVLRALAIGFIAVALARPQTYKTEILKIEGIDIMMVLDLSRSMVDTDLKPNRLIAGQCTLHNFLARRQSDRIGLVVFAREAMMQCPLTLDYKTLDDVIADLSIGDVPERGTAIGDALGLALASLRRSDAKSKVIILVSDGDSNQASAMEPEEAKDVAVEMGVRVFTVLMGQEEGRFPLSRGYGVNPRLMKEIARETGGLYFNAGDDKELAESFEKIREDLEKTEIKVVGKTEDRELFHFPLIPAAIFLLLEVFLTLTRFRRFP